MFRSTSLKRIATTAIAALAIGAGAASPASADELPIATAPDSATIHCNWTGKDSFMCKFGKTIAVCQKLGSDWYCGSTQCGCSAAEQQPADEGELRMMVAIAEPYSTSLAATGATPRR